MRVILILILYLFVFVSVRGNDITQLFSKYNSSYFTEDIGLPNNFVDDIFKDSHDYMWIATHNGLTRYDGYEFVVYNKESWPISLKNNFVHSLCEDNRNRLWIASEGGLDVVDLELYKNVSFDIDENDILEELFSSNLNLVYKDSHGDLWIASENSLFCLELDSNGNIADYYKLEQYLEKPVKAIKDLTWGICAGVDNSLKRIVKRKGHLLKTEPISSLVDKSFDDWDIHCIALDKDILWIGSNRGLFRYDHFNQTIKRYTHSSHKKGTLSQSHITDILVDEDGTLFVSTLKGLNIYDSITDQFYYIQKENENGLPMLNCDFINCLYKDKNCLWVGTEIGGLNLLSRGQLNTYTWVNNHADDKSLSPNAVNAICEGLNGDLWIGTVEGGLNLLTTEEPFFHHFVANSKDTTTIKHNSVCEILLDKDNTLWVCTWGGGINSLDLNIPNNKRFKQYRNRVNGVELNYVSSALEDPINNGIWFGTTEGLHFYDKDKTDFVKIKLGNSKNRFESINSLLIDSKNKLWVGTSKGIFIIDVFSFAKSRSNINYTYLNTKLSDSNDLVPDKINCIIQDTDGVIWIGTNGNGLYKLESVNNGIYQFKNYTIQDGLPNNNLLGIVEDNNNTLWISTNKGISQLNKSSMVFRNYTKYDGLLTNQFYWNAYLYSLSKDLVYFGNTEGLIAIDPNNLYKDSDTIQVSLTGLSVLGSLVYPNQGKYLKKDISCADVIHLHERDQIITINFSTKKYNSVNQTRYAYRLKGYNDKWIETKIGEHVVTYSSLPSGNYIFQVRATNVNGDWSDEIKEIKIEVSPYFYKSWWFISSLITILIIGSYWFYCWKTQKYRQQKEHLEKIVQDRTSELDKKNKYLLEAGRKLANVTEEKMTFFTHVVHEFRTPVTLINGPLEKALQQSKDPLVSDYLHIAERNSKYLLSLVNELMDFRKIESGEVQLIKTYENIQSFIEYVLMPFYAFAREQEVELTSYYHLSCTSLLLDYNYLRKVILNLVSNAIRFTPKEGSVKIYVAVFNTSKNETKLYINIRDTGSGISDNDLEKIFNQFYQSKESSENIELWKNSTGVGLYTCKKIINLFGGSIKAFNNKNKGASFRILLTDIVCGDTSECSSLKDNKTKLLIESEGQIKENILVVDDNPDMRFYIKTLLVNSYHVLEAQDGIEALSILKNSNIDLIISDLMMPVMDGLELSKRVKSDISISHIPFLILTALVSDEQKRISYQIGVDDYLSKPFDEKLLLLKIRNILEMRAKYKKQFSSTMNQQDLNITIESKDDKFIQKAMKLMSENYTNSEYELDSFIRDLGYSKTMVNKKLQDLTGQSIGQFIRNYRLNIARNILMNSVNLDVNISEIAYSVGFNDPKYFSRCFRDVYGVLPSSMLSKK